VKETSVAEEAKSEDSEEAKQNAEKKVKEAETHTTEDKGKPCELCVRKITNSDLFEKGLLENCVIAAINGIHIRGMTYEKQVGYLSNTKKPFKLTFTGPKYLKIKALQTIQYPGILRELTANGDNAVKSAFN